MNTLYVFVDTRNPQRILAGTRIKSKEKNGNAMMQWPGYSGLPEDHMLLKPVANKSDFSVVITDKRNPDNPHYVRVPKGDETKTVFLNAISSIDPGFLESADDATLEKLKTTESFSNEHYTVETRPMDRVSYSLEGTGLGRSHIQRSNELHIPLFSASQVEYDKAELRSLGFEAQPLDDFLDDQKKNIENYYVGASVEPSSLPEDVIDEIVNTRKIEGLSPRQIRTLTESALSKAMGRTPSDNELFNVLDGEPNEFVYSTNDAETKKSFQARMADLSGGNLPNAAMLASDHIRFHNSTSAYKAVSESILDLIKRSPHPAADSVVLMGYLHQFLAGDEVEGNLQSYYNYLCDVQSHYYLSKESEFPRFGLGNAEKFALNIIFAKYGFDDVVSKAHDYNAVVVHDSHLQNKVKRELVDVIDEFIKGSLPTVNNKESLEAMILMAGRVIGRTNTETATPLFSHQATFVEYRRGNTPFPDAPHAPKLR